MGSLAKNFLKLLEQARIEEIGEQLTAKGFSISNRRTVGVTHVSLLAEKPGLCVAYEVVSAERLQYLASDIAAKRQALLSNGVGRFFISVVSLPKTTEVEITGLLESLLDHLLSAGAEADIPRMGTLRALRDPVYDSVAIDLHKTRVVGSAFAVMSYIEPALYPSEDDEEYEREIPFNFDVTFSPDLKVKRIHFLEFDTSKYEF